MARPRTAILSREIIGRAAIEYVESGNELQLVPLARRLGV
ncbi:TetR family transcriptional regulator, partial [Leucobacter sp. OLES1]